MPFGWAHCRLRSTLALPILSARLLLGPVMGDYRRLQVWQRAHQLVLSIYLVTRTFPRDECFGLVAQMRRAAVSIPANLAEGCGRDTDPEIVRYARIALGSASELEY